MISKRCDVMDMMHVDVGYSNIEWEKDAKRMKEAAERLLLYYLERTGGKKKSDISDKDNIILEISLVDTETISSLNKRYKNKSGPATVLSFSYGDHIKNGDNFLGEIFLSPETIENKPNDNEFYLIHGLLHLLGFSHNTQSDRIEMEALEDEMWEQLNSGEQRR